MICQMLRNDSITMMTESFRNQRVGLVFTGGRSTTRLRSRGEGCGEGVGGKASLSGTRLADQWISAALYSLAGE
jgi:hypothetical protein